MAESDSVKINPKKFWERIEALHESWKRRHPGWHGCESILICCGSGKGDEHVTHLWLFRVELLNTIIIITNKCVTVCAGEKICKTLEQVGKASETGIELRFLHKKKDDGYKQNYEDILALIGKKVGYVDADQKGKFVQGFLERVKNGCEMVNFGDALSDVMMVKDTSERSTIRKAADLTSKVTKYFQKKMEDIIENETKVTHEKLSKELTAVLDNPKMVKSQLKKEFLDTCYDPIIQSGGDYRLKPSSISNKNPLHYDSGTIIVMLGYRLHDYCANIARTFLINASDEQKETYTVLTNAFKRGLGKLRNGAALSDVYNACIQSIKKSKKPELKANFLKNCGWGMGLEIRDRHYIINKKSSKVAKSGMVFNFQVGFEKLVDKSKESKGLDVASHYALIIADTVLVTDDIPEFLTNFHRKLIDYRLDDDEKEESSPPPPKRSKKKKSNAMDVDNASEDDEFAPAEEGRRVTRQSNRRTAKQQAEMEKARKERAKKQERLRNKVKNQLERILESTDGDFGLEEEETEWIDPNCYRDITRLPSTARGTRVHVDTEHDCVICPIMDHMVPFHVSVIKNCSISISGDFTYFRLNLISPAAPTKTNRQPKQPDVARAHPECMFIKELTFRSTDGTNLMSVNATLNGLLKKYRQRLKQSNEKPIVEQDKLRRNTTNRMLVLNDLTVRPSLGGRKKGTGRLECHANGFRYTDHKKQELHVMFNNIEHAFYQRAQNTPSVIIHLKLKNPIYVGKKPSEFVQFVRDVIEKFEDLGRNNYDYDGVRHEREERKRIAQINKKFSDFVQKVEEVMKKGGYGLEFDSPQMDLQLSGVPSKQNVSIYPTSKSLIALEDNPPFVLPMKDVQIAHFERVQFSLRNFDLVFVRKDLKKPVVRISAIPRNHLDTLQDFLNWKNVLFYENKSNLDWKVLLQKIREEFRRFVEEGGWDNVLGGQMGAAEMEDSDQGSVYAPSDFEEDEESEWDDDEYSDGEESEEYYDDEEEEYGDDDEEEEPGLSWEELERQAAAQDQMSRQKERNREFKQTRSQRNPKRRRLA